MEQYFSKTYVDVYAKKGTWSDRIYLFYFQILSDTYTTDHGGLRHHHHDHDDNDEEDHHEHVFPISRKPGIMGWENIFNLKKPLQI